jgi:hypothetical protein
VDEIHSDEMRPLMNKLKDRVTGATVNINPKNETDLYQLFIKIKMPGFREEVARLALGVNLGDAGVIGEALQARVDPSAGQRALQAGEPGPQAEQALEAAPHNNDALAAPLADNNDALAAALEQQAETVPKAWPVHEVPQQLRDADLEIDVADRKMALKRKHREMSDMDCEMAQAKLKLAEDQLKLERQQFELRREQEQWDIARQTQLLELELKRKQAVQD